MGGARKDFQTWGLFLLIPRSSFFHRELTLTPPASFQGKRHVLPCGRHGLRRSLCSPGATRWILANREGFERRSPLLPEAKVFSALASQIHALALGEGFVASAAPRTFRVIASLAGLSQGIKYTTGSKGLHVADWKWEGRICFLFFFLFPNGVTAHLEDFARDELLARVTAHPKA